jgi:site-specific DNA-cytosine methylase
VARGSASTEPMLTRVQLEGWLDGKVDLVDLATGMGGFTLAAGELVHDVLLYCDANPHIKKLLLARMSEKLLPRAPYHHDLHLLADSALWRRVLLKYGTSVRARPLMLTFGWPCKVSASGGHAFPPHCKH